MCQRTMAIQLWGDVDKYEAAIGCWAEQSYGTTEKKILL